MVIVLSGAAVVTGVILLVAVWLSVVRTVLIPRQSSSRMARWTVRGAAALGRWVALKLPRRMGEAVLDYCSPVALFVMVAGWLAGVGTGFGLLAVGMGGVEFSTDGMVGFFEMHGTGAAGVLAILAAFSATIVLAAFAAHLIRFVEAYSRRERLVIRLASQVSMVPDADQVLADYLRAGSRDALDARFAEWASWLADVHGSHVCYPGLIHHRPVGDLWWPKAAMIIMDAAALVEAVAPRWAPPHTRVLLDSGSVCLQQLACRIGIELPAMKVSLHGREERSFDDTVQLAVESGLPQERDAHQAWPAFQEIRVRYAPYAVMIGARLLYHREDDRVEQDCPQYL